MPITVVDGFGVIRAILFFGVKTISIKSKGIVVSMPPTTAGEICTEAKAIELGLYNEAQGTYVSGLEDMRTYSAANPNDYRKREALCRPTNDGAYAYPLCPIQHGFAFSQVAGDPSRCTVEACPPGFIPGSNQTCLKPTNSILKDKTGICDEKPTDWYSVPYYQLGNGFRNIGGKCYKPCEGPTVEVPLVNTDPVDGQNWGVVFTDPSIPVDGSRCVNIQNYMGEKYNAKNDRETKYCPAAVIKRLSVSAEELQKELQETAASELESVIDQVPASMRVRMNSLLSGEANTIAAETKRNLTNVKPISRSMQIACNRAVDPNEMVKLYATCKDLKDRPGTILQTWRGDDSSLTPEVIRIRRTVMEQACHEVFCNQPANAVGAGGQPVCFKDIKQVSQKELDLHNGQANYVAEKVAIPNGNNGKTITTANGKSPDDRFVSFFPKNYIKSILTFMTLILSMVGLFIIYKIIVMIFNYNKIIAAQEIARGE